MGLFTIPGRINGEADSFGNTYNNTRFRRYSLHAMKAKVATLMDNGKVINHRGFVDAAKWIDERINFLLTIYKFDDYKVTVTGNVYRLVAWRNAGKPGTNGKAMSVTHVITVVE